MKIVVDKEGLQAVTALCDIALKVGGVTNLDAVNSIRTGIFVDLPDAKEKAEAKVIGLETREAKP